DLVPRDLSDAPGHPEDEARLLLFLSREDPQRAVDLRLRLLANRAGIEEEDVGTLVVLGPAIAAGLEPTGHAVAVENVHLAAPRLDAIEPGNATIHRLCLPARFLPDRAHSRSQPGSAPAFLAFSGRSARSFSAVPSSLRAASSSSFFLSQAGLM